MVVTSYDELHAALAPEREALLAHPLYAAVASTPALRVLMQTHVFAVWDFMSLLKSLQRRLTCVTVPWIPPRSRIAARLVNAIVLAEESDEIDGRPISHFELYRQAMTEVDADVAPIDRLLGALGNGATVGTALEVADVPHHVRSFVACTFTHANAGHDEITAAAFLVGREDLVPEMFKRLLPTVTAEHRAPSFVRYLERHIEVDEGEHGPLARQLLTELCGDDPAAWQRAVDAGRAALLARSSLWDGVVTATTATTAAVSAR